MGKVKTNFKTKRHTFIRDWRKFRQMTLQKLADRIEVTPGALSQLERGDVAYTQPMLEALADALKCDPADLIMRSPTSTQTLQLIWDRVPESDRERDLKLLEAFAKAS